MPRIRRGTAAAATATEPETSTPVDVEQNTTSSLAEGEEVGGWNASNSSDPLTVNRAHLDAPAEEEVVYAEYREDDAPPMEEEPEDEGPAAFLEEVEDAASVEDPPEPEAEVEDPEEDPTSQVLAQKLEQAQGQPAIPNHGFQAPPLTGQEHPVFGKRLGAAEFVGEYEDGSPAWHAARAAGIGSSDAACVLNIGFVSAHLLWLQKKGYVEAEDLEANPRMAEILLTGHLREPEVAERFRRRHPQWSVHKGGSWRKADAPWMLSNPDRILLNTETGEISLLEIKSSESGTGYEDGKIPSKYVVQLRHQLWCMGLPYGYLGVVIGNSDYREYYVPADPTQEIVRLFARDNRREVRTTCHYGDGLTLEISEYNFLMAPEPPPMSHHKDIYEYLREKNPTLERNTEVDVPVDIATALREGQELVRQGEEKVDWAKNHMLAIMGTKHYAMYNGDKIARRQAKGDSPPFLVLT